VGALLVVVAVLLGLLALLAVPFDLAFRFRGVEAFEGRVGIRWLFGLLRFEFRIPGSAKGRPRKRRAKAKRAHPRATGRTAGDPKALALLRREDFRRRVYRLLRDLAGAAHLQQFSIRMRLGLGDPADTGRLWAIVGPLNAMAQNLRNAEVWIEPQFIEPTLEFDAHGRVGLMPLQLLALLIGFALSPTSMRAWRAVGTDHA